MRLIRSLRGAECAFYHGLRVTELCRLNRQAVDLTQGRIWMQRLKGSLSTEQPLHAAELRTLKRYVQQAGPGPAALAVSEQTGRSVHAFGH